MSDPQARLEVERLRIILSASGSDVVDEISFSVPPGEILGLVGESGSGKTTLALALLAHTRRGLRLKSGQVRLDGVDLFRLAPAQLRAVRGSQVTYVPQDPTSALNPALRVRTQLREVLSANGKPALPAGELDTRLMDVLGEAGLGGRADLLQAYPHQLSGGQQQRMTIAMAFACRPKLIVLDEPTTGLDVTTQRHVLQTIKNMCKTYGVAAVYVSHDLAVVSELANRVAVMYAGRIVELGPTPRVLSTPVHPYTRGLIGSIPSPERADVLVPIEGQLPRPTHRPPGCAFAPRCPIAVPACEHAPPPVVALDHGTRLVRCFRAAESSAVRQEARIPITPPMIDGSENFTLSMSKVSASYGQHQVLFDIGLGLRAKRCLAVVGESGSGKTTLARCVVGLHQTWSGQIMFAGNPLALGAHRPLNTLQRIQYVFQNPYTALNPRKTVGQLLDQPLAHFTSLPPAERETLVVKVLIDVGLSSAFLSRYPAQLSGGERQRIAIARALVVEPDLLICDEVTSALDVSVQAMIIELLRHLQAQSGLTMVFITHNLALVRSIAQDVVVLSDGRVVEAGSVQEVLDHPRHPYTVRLMEDVPKLGRRAARSPSHSGRVH